jgi:hypothetical protein
MTSRVARATPPRLPRLARLRMKTPGVEEVRLHADAVAQHCAAAERARRVDGHDAHLLARGPEARRDAVGQGGLARPRRPRDADHLRRPGLLVDARHHLRQLGGAVLDQGHEARQRHAVAREHTIDELQRGPRAHPTILTASPASYHTTLTPDRASG